MENNENAPVSRKQRSEVGVKDLEIIYSMRQDGDTFEKIAKNLGFATSTVKNRFAQIEKCKENDIGLESLIKQKGRPAFDDSTTLLTIQQIIQDDPLLTQKGIKTKLNERSIVRSQSTISRKLKSVDITRKRAKKVYSKVIDLRVINQRKAFSVKYRNISNSRLLYLDETGLNLHSVYNYGYSPKNTPVNVMVRPRCNNVSNVVLISCEEILKYKTIEGAYNADLFVEFLQECVNSNIDFKNKILLMDNVRFHKTSAIKDFLNDNSIAFDFIPPYSPQLNPIEEIFGVFKARYYNKRPVPQTNFEIKRVAGNVFDEMNDDSELVMNRFYVHMREFMDLAYNGSFF